eukprot:1873481-Prymnesium_polylepis.1
MCVARGDIEDACMQKPHNTSSDGDGCIKTLSKLLKVVEGRVREADDFAALATLAQTWPATACKRAEHIAARDTGRRPDV